VLDKKLQVAMKDVLPADDYKKLQERMNELQNKFDDAANGDGG
jgi:tetrahydromethanopterin S-methyltransferase subunit G